MQSDSNALPVHAAQSNGKIAKSPAAKPVITKFLCSRKSC